MIDLGDAVLKSVTNTDALGAPADAGAMTCTITLPDLTIVTPTIVRPGGAGIYSFTYLTAQAGLHRVKWLATGVNPGAYPDVFTVQPATVPGLISLDDARASLGVTLTATNEELRYFIAVAEAAVTKLCGPLLPTVVTASRVGGNRDMLAVYTHPCISLTSVTDSITGLALDVSKLTISRGGVIEFLAGGTFGARFYDVVYTAGRTTCPNDLYNGVLEMLRHVWQTQRGSAKRAGSDNTVAATPGYWLPSRVQGALEPHMQNGFA